MTETALVTGHVPAAQQSTSPVSSLQGLSMQFHPYSEIFPLIEGADFDALVDDIKAHGLREKIYLYDGKILDGRNRFLACQKARVKPLYRKFTGHDALAFVVSANIRRRHLSDAQRAMAAARVASLAKGDNQHASREAPSQTAAAESLDVSRSSVQRARKVIEGGSKALQSAVESGEVPLKRAAEVIDLPKSEQLSAAKQKPEKAEPDVPDFAARYEFDANDDAVLAQTEREYQQAIDNVIESDDKLASANAEIKRLSGLVAVLTKARDEYMNRNGEAVGFIKRLQRENDRLRKALGKYEPKANGEAARA